MPLTRTFQTLMLPKKPQHKDKTSLRLAAKAILENLSRSGELEKRKEIAIQKITNADFFATAKTILFYNALKDEIDLNALTEMFSDKVFLTTEITENSPSENFIQQCKNLDLIIIPGLSFDKRGYRLGRGGGYYDKLLSRINPQNQLKENAESKTTYQSSSKLTPRSPVLILGIIPKELYLENLPNEPHDMKVDLVLTV
ncbi:MAG: 5-formyltetrahydrofolate cyclo-ligase [bacterium]